MQCISRYERGVCFVVKLTSSSTRSSEASAMIPSWDQSRASMQDGQHLSSVTSDIVT
jgi:hypothetical protein